MPDNYAPAVAADNARAAEIGPGLAQARALLMEEAKRIAARDPLLAMAYRVSVDLLRKKEMSW